MTPGPMLTADTAVIGEGFLDGIGESGPADELPAQWPRQTPRADH